MTTMVAVDGVGTAASGNGERITTLTGLRAALNGRNLTQKPLTVQLILGGGLQPVNNSCLVIVDTDLAAVFSVTAVVAIQDRRADQMDLGGDKLTDMWGLTVEQLMPTPHTVSPADIVSRITALQSGPRPPTARFGVGVWDPVLGEVVICEVRLKGDTLQFYVPDDVIGRIQGTFGTAWYAKLTSNQRS